MMNLQNFELLKEDVNNYHVGHPNGKAIVVSKSGLSEKAHNVIKKLKSKKMAKGGEVKKDDEEKDINPISLSFINATGTNAIAKPQPQSSSPLPMNYADGGDVPSADGTYSVNTEDKTGDLF